LNGFRSPEVTDNWTTELKAREGLIAVGSDGIRVLRSVLVGLGHLDEGGKVGAVMLGKGLRTPTQALDLGTKILAGLLGVDTVEAEMERLRSDLTPTAEAGASVGDAEGLHRVPAILRTKERELSELRADAAEVGGDLEFANMQWHRERQDAETQLLAYRDRARELKGRLQQLEVGGSDADCPTCQRVLQDRFDPVITQIREEWEAVVQDGSWWKRRRDQLDPKPEDLRDLERRSIRLQAAIEGCAEEIERLRARLPELASGAGVGLVSAGTPAAAGHPRLKVLEALRTELADEARDLLIGRAGRYLNRLTAGDVLALAVDDECVRFVRDHGADEPIGGADRASLVLALRLALADMCARHGLNVETLVFGGLLDELPLDTAVRAVVLFRGMLGRSKRVIVECGPDVMKSAPEFFDWVLEVERKAGKTQLRATPGGVGKLRVH
jgi:hypothetical protein